MQQCVRDGCSCKLRLVSFIQFLGAGYYSCRRMLHTCTKRVGKDRHITELTLNNTVCVVASSICSIYFCTLESVARTLLLAHEQLKQGHVSILIRILVY